MTKPAPDEIAPRLFEDILHRAQTMIPDGYLPAASYVLIADVDLLRAAGHWPGAPEPTDWSRGASGFRKIARDGRTAFWVQRWGQFWIVERSLRVDDRHMVDQALACAFGRAPIWTRSRQAAMRLAEHCDPIPRAPVAGFWADVGNIILPR